MPRLISLALAALLLAVVGCASSLQVPADVLDRYPDLRNGGALDARLGAHGYKSVRRSWRSAWVKKRKFFEPDATVALTASDSFVVFAYDYSEADSLSIATQVSLKKLRADAGLERAERVGYHMVFFGIRDTRQLRDALNKEMEGDPYLAALLRRRQSRVVDAVGVVTAYDKSATTLLTGKVKGEIKGQSLELSASDGRKQTVKLGDGSVLVYRLATVCWSRDSTRVLHVVRDALGESVRDRCPR
jgi:hypothetical protein